jgi:hypothetical protein
MVQVVEYLPRKGEALSSNSSSTTQKYINKKTTANTQVLPHKKKTAAKGV